MREILLNYGYLEQIKDILPGILLSVIMGVAIYMFNFMNISEWQKLLIQNGKNGYLMIITGW